MRNCSTCCTRAKTFDLGYQSTRPNDKLEFVEHVLGVLIESRFGDRNPYTRLGERPVTTGRSQMFANVTLFSAAEIQTHLEFGDAHHRPFHAAFLRELPLGSRPEERPSAKAVANGSDPTNITGFSPTLFWAKAREVLEALIRRLKPTAIQRTQHDHSSMPRGSPTFSGTLFFASSFANFANFA